MLDIIKSLKWNNMEKCEFFTDINLPNNDTLKHAVEAIIYGVAESPREPKAVENLKKLRSTHLWSTGMAHLWNLILRLLADTSIEEDPETFKDISAPEATSSMQEWYNAGLYRGAIVAMKSHSLPQVRPRSAYHRHLLETLQKPKIPVPDLLLPYSITLSVPKIRKSTSYFTNIQKRRQAFCIPSSPSNAIAKDPISATPELCAVVPQW